MKFIESSLRHLDQQQVHNMNWLMMAVEEISEDEAVEEALALVVAVDRLIDITVE